MDNKMDKQDRVMLQYSVQLDEVPKELKRLIEKANILTRGSLAARFKKLIATDTAELLQETAASDISRVRAALANVDIILSDAENIINGYISMSQEEEQQIQTEQEIEPTIDIADDLDNILDSSDLSETINLFKQQQGLQDAAKPTKDPTSK
tara:strand:+ start:303 stop:758 length:456 start_codon:yes stop_codon:yes gene_type:complete